MMKLRWVMLLTALTVLLTACPPTETPGEAKLTLVANPNPVPAGGAPVKLDATITEGLENVASVDFAVKDAGTALGQGTQTDSVFTFTTSPVTTDTTFVATARNSDGNAIGTSNEVTVTVSAPSTGVTVALTANPSSLAAPGATTLTAVISGPDAAKITSVVFNTQAGTRVSVDSTPADGFTAPIANVAQTTTYVATARENNAERGTAQVTVTVAANGGAIPAGASKAATAAAINAVTATSGDAAVIAVTADITCTASDPDPCIQLDEGQRLVGANTAGTAIATRTITVSRTAASPTTVIALGNNSTVESVDIAGTGIYEAIVGGLGATPLTGTVTIKNVAINMGASVRGAILIGSEAAADRTNTVVLDTVTITGLASGRTGVDIKSASSVSVLNSSVAFDAANTAGTGFAVVGVSTSVTLDGARVTSAATSDPDAVAPAPKIYNPAFNIYKKAGAAALNLTARNTNSALPATGVAFFLTGDAGQQITIQTGSTGNQTTVGAANRVRDTGRFTGTIEFTN